MKFVLTKEQENIVKGFPDKVVKVNACAGSGKSSTLRMYAEAHPCKSLYICFNKVIQEEAQNTFPSYVECRTAHSLAYGMWGSKLRHKLPSSKDYTLVRTLTGMVDHYGVKEVALPNTTITPIQIMYLARLFVDRWEQSGDAKLSNKTFPHMDVAKMLSEEKKESVKKEVYGIVWELAERLKSDRCNVDSKIVASHDTYLKLWQLSSPVLDYEIIYVDECQDMSGVMLDVLQKQTHAKVIYVGDNRQSIYQFRGAVNAMERITAKELSLSKSFRYGRDIADVANYILYDNSFTVEGNENIDSKVKCSSNNNNSKYTKIYRTNAALLHEAVSLAFKGVKVRCEVDIKSFINKLQSVETVYLGKPAKHPEISIYKNWDQILVGGEDDAELARLIKIVEKGDTKKYIASLSRLTQSKKYDVLLTTAHKSKGKEWGVVEIANDFKLSPFMEENNNEAEINLFYVACTRAINTLYLPEEYYDEWSRNYRDV